MSDFRSGILYYLKAVLLNKIILYFQVHAYIISHLKKEMPSMFGKESKKKDLIANLGSIFASIQREHQISPGDFPNLERMQVNIV